MIYIHKIEGKFADSPAAFNGYWWLLTLWDSDPFAIDDFPIGESASFSGSQRVNSGVRTTE